MRKLVHVAIVSSFVLSSCAPYASSISATDVSPNISSYIASDVINLDGVIDSDGSDTGYGCWLRSGIFCQWRRRLSGGL